MEFTLKIKELMSLPLDMPTGEVTIFKSTGNSDEIIGKIMANSSEPDFKNMLVNNGNMIDGMLRYNTILAFVNEKITYKGKKINEFSQAEWDRFYDFKFVVKMDNTDSSKYTEFFKKLNS